MFKEKDLNLGGEQKIKTYAEMSENERREFKEQKESELENLKESLVKYGVPVKGTETEIVTERGVIGVEFSIKEEEGELKLIIDQECGKGIAGLGFDKKIWICLNQEREINEKGKSIIRDIVNEYDSDANTIVSLESNFKGVRFEKVGEEKVKVQIDSDHPIIAIAKFLGNKEIQLRGTYNGWGDSDPFEFNQETGKWEAVLDWNDEEEKCKIMIRDIEYKEGEKVTKPMKAEWNGNFGKRAEQKMKINLEEEK